MLPTVEFLSHGMLCGYGVAGERMARALGEAGVPLRWTPIQFHHLRPLLPESFRSWPALDRYRGTALDRPDVVVVNAVPEVLPALQDRRPAGTALVCLTVWEHEELQPHWPGLLNTCDAVLVPTEWNAEAFRAGGVTVPVGVVPHVAADAVPDPTWLGPSGLDLGDRFLTHSVAAWNDRKQPGRTVEAFARAFGPEDRAALLLRTDRELDATVPDPPGPPDRRRLTSWSVASIVHRHHPTGDVRLLHDVISDEDVAGLHARSDCWISLPHAEGWDLGAFDAALAGTPVLTTAGPWTPAFLDPTSPLLVPGRPSRNPNVPGTTWLDPDLDAAVEALRSVAADPASARARAEAWAIEVAPRFAPGAVAARFLAVLAELGVT